MSTSLAEQLRRLAVPQTSILVDSKKRASILFDPKEAANKDRKTIFDLGHAGLMELIALNSNFAQFEQTLFDKTALHMERSVESADVNKQLNKNIKKFFHHLSPYFMLHPAHLCLEWLIRRFHIHEFNKDEFVGLILPYHETKIFVRCVQTLNLRNPNDNWYWLKTIQKPGVSLSKTSIFNRASSDSFFLKFVSKYTTDAVKELDSKAHTLQSQINFYCTTLIGAMQNAVTIGEAFVADTLPSILKGLSSKAVDFAAAAFMIISQLAAKSKLSQDVLEVLVTKICNVPFESMQADIILLLIWLARTQAENFNSLPDANFIKFVSNKWLTKTIGSLAAQSVAVAAICVPLLSDCLKRFQGKDEGWTSCKEFLEQLLYDVQFAESDAKEVIRTVLESYRVPAHKISKKSSSESEIIELDSDNEDGGSQDSQSWYSNYLQKLENQYPTEFEHVIKALMQENVKESDPKKQALKIILAFRLKSTCNESDTTLYENLYHYSSRNRVEAVKFLVKNFEKLQLSSNSMELMKESLSDRLKDDNALVVGEVLKLQPKRLVEIIGRDSLIESLIGVLAKANIERSVWHKILPSVLDHLINKDVFEGQCPIKMIILLMPLLCPLVAFDNSTVLIEKILNSEVVKILPFLKELKASKNLDIEAFGSVFFDVVADSISAPSAVQILNSLKTNPSVFTASSMNFTNVLGLLCVCFKKDTPSEVGLDIFNEVCKHLLNFRVCHLEKEEEGKISQDVLLNLLNALVMNSKYESNENRIPHSTFFILIVRIYELLTLKAFSSKNPSEKIAYVQALKKFINNVFPTVIGKLGFLSNFFIYEKLGDIKLTPELRIRSMKLFIAVLQGKDTTFLIDRNIYIKLILSLGSSIAPLRECALDSLEAVALSENLPENYQTITKALLAKKEELLMDSDQLPLILFTVISSNKKAKDEAKFVRNELFAAVADPEVDNYLRAKLLAALQHVNGTQFLKALLPVGLRTLESCTASNKDFAELSNENGEIFRRILDRYDETTIQIIGSCSDGWDFIQNSLKLSKTLTTANNRLVPIASLTIDHFDEIVYNKMAEKYKQNFISLVVNAAATAENNDLFLCANKLFKRCSVDAKSVLVLLEDMRDSCYKTGVKSINPDAAVLNREPWKQGMTLLELLENKKKLSNSHLLIPVCFEILQRCLEFEEQSSLEYAKQLILSTLLHCCQKSFAENVTQFKKKVPESAFRIDLIVQCVRATQNPQTHHHALLLLSHCALMFPHQVLHNMMDIFTFMGSSVVRHDDTFSFQLISNIIEAVVPTLVGRGEAGQKSQELVIPVFKVFADIILDVPEHRRLPLYVKLLTTLDADKYLWMFLCVVFESHVVHDDKEKTSKTKSSTVRLSSDEFPKRIDIALKLSKSFGAKTILETCIALFVYLKGIPEQNAGEEIMDVDGVEQCIFDMKARSSKQLRHYKYIILQFISALTSSTEFVNLIAVLDDDETKSMKSFYQNFIIKTLSYIPYVTACIEKNTDLNQVKFWKVILHHCYVILENAISLLSPDMFLVVIHGLMQHQLPTVRKKVIELLISKLQQKNDYFDKCNEENILNLLDPLNDIINSILDEDKSSSSDSILIQQTALIAIKLLSKLYALKYIEQFKEVLNKLTKIIKKRNHCSKIILATVLLAMIEIASSLKAHSIALLPKLMPHIVEILQNQAELIAVQAPDNICIAVVTGVQKLFEVLPLFLGPYIFDIITALCTIWVHTIRYEAEHDQKATVLLNKLNLIWTKIPMEVPARVFVPNCEKVYSKLMEEGVYDGIEILMKLLVECFQSSADFDFNSVENELTEFFLKALNFRSQLDTNVNQAQINRTEEKILEAFVAWVLKLSESSFRPLYHKIYDWAIRDSVHKSNVITYFILSDKIAESLKSLFVLFAGDFVQDAATLLDKCNRVKSDDLYYADSEEKNLLLVRSILSTLKHVFLYDNSRFVNPHRFDILMQPIVDQLENSLILNSEDDTHLLAACISQLAVAVSNDVLWKQLNYQVLLKTRTNRSEVRIVAFNCCVEIARKLGEDFTTLLPETIPFIAELFEDENPKVENNTRKGVQELEKTLGESLQKYL